MPKEIYTKELTVEYRFNNLRIVKFREMDNLFKLKPKQHEKLKRISAKSLVRIKYHIMGEDKAPLIIGISRVYKFPKIIISWNPKQWSIIWQTLLQTQK